MKLSPAIKLDNIYRKISTVISGDIVKISVPAWVISERTPIKSLM